MTAALVDTLRRLPDIPEEKNTWRVFLNGEELDNKEIRHLLLVLQKPDRPALGLELGYIDDGKLQYDGLSHFEMAGGGVVVIPFLVLDGELYVALVNQTRFHVGGGVETVPRGYAEIGKTAEKQADDEAREEMGAVTAFWKPFPLKGEPVNPNTSISNTSRPHPDGGRAGSRFFAREISLDCIEMGPNHEPKFKEGAVNPTDPKEQILSWRLAHWTAAMRLHDACPINATGRLMAELHELGRLSMHVT